MKFKDLVKQGFSAAVTFGGFAVTTVCLVESFEAIPFIIGGLAPMIGGGLALKHFRKEYILDKRQELEQRVLELFTVYQGQMTVAQMAMALKMPVEVIDHEMNRLQAKGVLEINLTSNGAVVYKVPHLKPSASQDDVLLDA